jgi:hypothetical protein
MEFKITKKANILTLVLITVGLLFTGIGIAVETGHEHGHHLGQRLAANLLVDSFFFFGIGLGSLFFLALQYATETGWYATVKRVIEAVAGYLPVGIIMMTVTLLIITLQDGAHIYLWMDKNVVAHDEIIKGKSAFLNKGFFWLRTAVYLFVYYIYWNGFRKRSLQEDIEGGTKIHFTNYKKSAVFLGLQKDKKDTQENKWNLSVMKNRNGLEGKLQFFHNLQYGQFYIAGTDSDYVEDETTKKKPKEPKEARQKEDWS